MNSADIQLVFLPPIGSDERAFYPQRALPFTVITPKHIEWRDGESLHDHAKRYFDHLAATKQVDLARPIVWAGLSLGGAMAQEFSALHKPLGQILLGTFTSRDELAPVVRSMGKLSTAIPLTLYSLAGYIAPVVMKSMRYMSSNDIDMMVAGYRAMSKGSFRNTWRAISEWPGAPHNPNIPTLRIHGSKDPLIPIGRISEHVDVVLDTMHLVTLATPAEVNQSVTRFVDRLTS